MKLVLVCLWILAVATGPLCAAELLVGWASTSITPDRPVTLSGQMYTRISKSVNDPVTATVLALESGSEQAILVSLDLTGVTSPMMDSVRSRLNVLLPEFDSRKLIMNATHTHTAPEMREGAYQIPEGVMKPAEFVEFLAGKVSAAAVEAWNARRPAGVSWALGHAVIGYNRRAAFSGGRTVMYAKLDQPGFLSMEGFEDHGIELLFFWTPDRALTGIGVNLACPSQVSEHEYFISADFWDDTRKELRARYGQQLFVFPMTGASGDQSPHVQLRKTAENRMRQRLGLTVRLQIARRIAHAVEEVHPAAAGGIHTAVAFRHHVEELRLPVRMVTPAEFEWAQSESRLLEQAPATQADRAWRLLRARQVMERYRKQNGEQEWPIELHVIRLGDIALATNPFELFLDFGIRMKARSRAEQTFVVQLACDYAGYLPTEKALSGGGYGAEIPSNQVGPEGGQVLVDRTVAIINSLFE